MIDLALDPSDTRPSRAPGALPARTSRLRMVAFALVGASALGGFGVAASTLMAGLAAPAPIKRSAPARAADWPDLKDGLPALTVTNTTAPQKPEQPEAPALRMASLPDPIAALPIAEKPARQAAETVAPRAVAIAAAPVAPAAPPEAPTTRIPRPTPVAAMGPTRQVTPLAPTRTAALQPPQASETVRARTEAEPAAKAEPITRAAAVPASNAALKAPDKVQRKVAAARKPVPAASGEAPAAIASAEAEPEETEVLGIKLPSLAPAGRKLKDGVDALGEAVRSVF